MSKVAQITREDMTQHGKKSLKQIDKMLKVIEEDLGEPITMVVMMSAQQLHRINALVRGSEVLLHQSREIAGRMLELQSKGQPLDSQVAALIDLVTAPLAGKAEKEVIQ